MSALAAPSFGMRRGDRRWAALVAAGLFAVVLVIGLRVAHTTGPLHVDQLGARVVDSTSGTRHSFHRLVWLGSPGFVGSAVVALALWRLLERDVIGAALAAFAPVLAIVLTEAVAKPLIGRHMGVGGHAFAFPSGHVTGASALAAVAVALAVRQWGRPAAWSALPAVLLPLGVGAGVVRAGFHYATDAVGGIGMGFSAVLLVVVVCSAFEDHRTRGNGAPVTAGSARP